MPNEEKNERLEQIERQCSAMAETLSRLEADLTEARRNLQKRKSENTALKILFYTGLTVLLIGFVFSTHTIQQTQLHSLESNLSQLQTQINHDLLIMQKNVQEEMAKHHPDEEDVQSESNPPDPEPSP
ncbi:MAG: hypothetical protein G3M78_14995 [Candidatus Nitrohelix vancouverensis]|uniref:Uncharacterized protein n=1 Tax=Candidatus Nitrohelix vancouverensis TaxID=2705534 RepID=A0A7T0C4V2_9BACT|nr:MAG: hypothetical protein G3M78_14995 [Candidatus Nitrohelix vancouverensis]